MKKEKNVSMNFSRRKKVLIQRLLMQIVISLKLNYNKTFFFISLSNILYFLLVKFLIIFIAYQLNLNQLKHIAINIIEYFALQHLKILFKFSFTVIR